MYGSKIDQLPDLSWVEFKSRVQGGEQLVVFEGVVHNVENFVHEHPGTYNADNLCYFSTWN